MNDNLPTFLALVVLLLGPVLVGCGADEKPSLTGNWTIQEEAVSLNRTLHVSDNEALYFGDIRDVAVDGEGRMYVADGKAHHVKMLFPDGTYIDSLGTQGRGPGQFKRPSQVFLARGDSLFVLDGYYGELSSFGPGHSFAHRRSLKAGQSSVQQILPFSETYAVHYSVPFLPGDDSRKDGAVRTVSLDGTAGDTLFTVPPPQIHIGQGNGYVRFRAIPFAREPYVRGGPSGRIHYVWNDSMTVMTYDRDGRLRDTVDVPFEPVPVTEADREAALSGNPAEYKAAVEDEIPATKPAFKHFLMDEKGRYWFGRPTAHRDSLTWWIAQPDEKRVMTESLPDEVELLTVKNGQAYGRTTTEAGAPALVRYRIDLEK